MQDTSGEHSTLQLVVDQIEELIVSLIEQIRERPAVAAAILAGVVGALVGSALAVRRRSIPAPPQRIARRARGMGDVAELTSLALRLLENPIVRAILLNQLRKRIFR